MRRPKVRALSATLIGSTLRAALGVAGRVRAAIASATIPIGTLMRKSHCQEATDRTAAATLGLAAEDTATMTAMLATPWPRREEG